MARIALVCVTMATALAGCGGSSGNSNGSTGAAARPHGKLDPRALDAALQAQGEDTQGVLMYDIPRSDRRFDRAGVPVQPSLDQRAEIHFVPLGRDSALVGGELPLLQREAPRVLAALASARIQVTALHNHITQLTPVVLWAHFTARGDPVKIARAVHRALRLTSIPLPAKRSSASRTPLDVKQLKQLVGGEAMVAEGGVVALQIARRDPVEVSGVATPPSFGLEADVYFEPLGRGRAASTGELPLIASEVNPVVRTLERGGLAPTAVHNHWVDDQPHLFYVHYWGVGPAASLARAVRSALDRAAFQRGS